MSHAEIVTILREFIRRELLDDAGYPLRSDEPLVSGGIIDSFMVAHLAVFVEQTFGVYVPDTALLSDEIDSLDRLAGFVTAHHGDRRDER